jgi:hypothetical protein
VGAPYAPPQPPAQDFSLAETAAGRPIDPAVARRPAQQNRLAPILVGAVAVLLLGSAAVAMVVMGKRKGGTDANAAGSASATPSAAPTDSASAAPTDSASAAPSATPAAPTETPSAAPVADSASAAAGPAPNEATLTCVPDCDEIKLDDKPLDLSKPIVIEPGKHTLIASKSGYYPVKETLIVKQGQKVEKMFTLKEKPAAPVSTGGPGPGPSNTGPLKPCGKFLKRAGCK